MLNLMLLYLAMDKRILKNKSINSIETLTRNMKNFRKNSHSIIYVKNILNKLNLTSDKLMILLVKIGALLMESNNS